MKIQDKILLVEDDKNLGFVIKDNLESEGFIVDLASTGKEGYEMFLQNEYTLALLDVMLPEQDGFTLARNIREKDDNIPLIFVTARSLEEDKLTGFRTGADDYITKPFNMEELIFRIRVFLKRSGNIGDNISENRKEEYSVGEFFFRPESLVLKSKSGELKLTQRETNLLELFCLNKNKILKRSEILVSIWGSDDYFLGRSLDVFISRLRKYLKADPNLQITNHHGVGFQLIDKK
ncbi:response regulator transcription factor [Bacteroidota bacterium]